MNERIKELVDQSRDMVWTKVTLGHDIYIPDQYKKGDINLEKFAKSLIQECSDVVVNKGYGGYYSGGPLGTRRPCTPIEIAQMIKEHFGVKE
jgi:hypothetical protein